MTRSDSLGLRSVPFITTTQCWSYTLCKPIVRNAMQDMLFSLNTVISDTVIQSIHLDHSRLKFFPSHAFCGQGHKEPLLGARNWRRMIGWNYKWAPKSTENRNGIHVQKLNYHCEFRWVLWQPGIWNCSVSWLRSKNIATATNTRISFWCSRVATFSNCQIVWLIISLIPCFSNSILTGNEQASASL